MVYVRFCDLKQVDCIKFFDLKRVIMALSRTTIYGKYCISIQVKNRNCTFPYVPRLPKVSTVMMSLSVDDSPAGRATEYTIEIGASKSAYRMERVYIAN